MILAGTGGFQHRDWERVFYPAGLNPALWLEYYSRHFGCCERTFTYYRIPETLSLQQLINETGSLQFVFRVPFRVVAGQDENGELARRFAASLWPLKDGGQMAGVVAQFGPDFGFNREHFGCLCRLRDVLRRLSLIADFTCFENKEACHGFHGFHGNHNSQNR